MKLLPITIILALLLQTQKSRAEDPENPFANLPANNEETFDPFDDGDFQEFDGAEGGGARPSHSPGKKNGGMPSGGGAPGGFPAPSNSRSAPPSGGTITGGPKSPSPGVPRLEPANAKDMVENFDYPDAEILDVTKAIAKLTGKNFIYNPQDIKGRISVVSQTPITVGDAWNAFLTALNMKNFALVPSGKYLRIERVANAKEKQTPIYADRKSPNNDEFITRVIPLRYIDATEFEQAFRLWMPREARIQAYGQTNTIILTDTASHINRMMELVNLLDVAGYQESLVVIPVKNATAKDIARLIEQILNENRSGSNSSPGFGIPPRPQGAFGGAARSTRGRSGGSTISKIIADDRTNSLIVKANAAGILEIRSLVRRLDQKAPPSDGSGRIHLIRLQFTDAETLAKTLQAVTTGSGSKSSGPRTFPVFGESQSQASVFQSEIKVAADKTTQSLLVTASPQDFATLKKVVEGLDLPRDQVFIEALILELTLNRDNAFGTSFISAPNGTGLPSASGNLFSLLGGSPIKGGLALGFKHGAERTFGTGDKAITVNSLNGLIELIQGNADANVVATPQIIALDNEEANFEISEEVKVENITTAANGGTTKSYSPDTATLSLKVKPQINKASNFVKLDIEQKLQNFSDTNVPKDLQGVTRGKNTRSTNTKLIVQNEDTVVISGLIKDTVSETVKKVPLLGDIPILGWLFKSSSAEVRKTNLLVFITPRIIKQYDTVRKVLHSKLDERDEFIRENLGSKDPNGRRVERMRKGLPDLTVIEPLPKSRPLETSSFNTPSAPDRDEEENYDPNFYPPESIPLPPVENNPPEIGNPDGSSPPPVLPQDGGF